MPRNRFERRCWPQEVGQLAAKPHLEIVPLFYCFRPLDRWLGAASFYHPDRILYGFHLVECAHADHYQKDVMTIGLKSAGFVSESLDEVVFIAGFTTML
jgi:hypothetical protein